MLPKMSSEREPVETYEVEKILDIKEENGVTLYLIRWSGFSSTEDSWEPYENLTEGCDRLIEQYRMKAEAKKGRSSGASSRCSDGSGSSVHHSNRYGTWEYETVELMPPEEWNKFGDVENREIGNLYIPDRIPTETEKLLCAFTPGEGRVTRNQLRAVMGMSTTNSKPADVKPAVNGGRGGRKGSGGKGSQRNRKKASTANEENSVSSFSNVKNEQPGDDNVSESSPTTASVSVISDNTPAALLLSAKAELPDEELLDKIPEVAVESAATDTTPGKTEKESSGRGRGRGGRGRGTSSRGKKKSAASTPSTTENASAATSRQRGRGRGRGRGRQSRTISREGTPLNTRNQLNDDDVFDSSDVPAKKQRSRKRKSAANDVEPEHDDNSAPPLGDSTAPEPMDLEAGAAVECIDVETEPVIEIQPVEQSVSIEEQSVSADSTAPLPKKKPPPLRKKQADAKAAKTGAEASAAETEGRKEVVERRAVSESLKGISFNKRARNFQGAASELSSAANATQGDMQRDHSVCASGALTTDTSNELADAEFDREDEILSDPSTWLCCDELPLPLSPNGSRIDLLQIDHARRMQMRRQRRLTTFMDFRDAALSKNVPALYYTLRIPDKIPFNVDEVLHSKTVTMEVCEQPCDPAHIVDDILRQLVSGGAHLDLTDGVRGRTPLHIAAAGDFYCRLKALLMLRSPVNVLDDDGRTPLQIALMSRSNKFQIMRTTFLLLQFGADVNDIIKKYPNGRFNQKLKEHQQRIIAQFDAARMKTLIDMTVKRMLTPVIVRAMWEFEKDDFVFEHSFPHETFYLPNDRYVFVVLLAAFDFASPRKWRLRMWGRSPFVEVSLNGRRGIPLQAGSQSGFVYGVVPINGYNKLRIRFDPYVARKKLLLLAQVLLVQLHKPQRFIPPPRLEVAPENGTDWRTD